MKKRNPRHGSMQFWPRVRAKNTHARIRFFPEGNGALGFAGYKVGMTHVSLIDNRATTKTKGEEISWPVTIIECPPLKAVSIRFYKKSGYGLQPLSQLNSKTLDKELKRRINLPKKEQSTEEPKEFDELTIIVHTQPKLTGIGKKKPEIFELAIGGKKEDKLAYAKEKLGKEITVDEIFKEGEQLDVHSVTTGKGFQGPVKRFGINLKAKKSEKGQRAPGSLGGWKGHGHVMYRVAHAGQTGYHQRTEFNKILVKISNNAEEVQQKGGFLHYGTIKNPYIILKGSIGGPKKRLIKLVHASRPDKTMPKEAPSITYISKESKQ